MIDDNRFFITAEAADRQRLLALERYGLDLFGATATCTDAGHYRVEGLVTLDEVGQLVRDGYRVTVEAQASQRAGARAIARFDEWLDGMNGTS